MRTFGFAMFSDLRRRIQEARAAIQTHAQDVWRRDRARFGAGAPSRVGFSGSRSRRPAVCSVHQLGFQAAALTYYTAFSLVPLLVVVLWIVKTFDTHLGSAVPAMPLARENWRGGTRRCTPC